MSEFERACYARDLYRAGAIDRETAERMMERYAREYNEKSKAIARRHGVRPRRFSFAAFCR